MKLLAREGRGFSFEVIRAKVLLINGLRKEMRPGYDKAWDGTSEEALTVDQSLDQHFSMVPLD